MKGFASKMRLTLVIKLLLTFCFDRTRSSLAGLRAQQMQSVYQRNDALKTAPIKCIKVRCPDLNNTAPQNRKPTKLYEISGWNSTNTLECVTHKLSLQHLQCHYFWDSQLSKGQRLSETTQLSHIRSMWRATGDLTDTSNPIIRVECTASK